MSKKPVFQIGDTVYHHTHGEGKIRQIFIDDEDVAGPTYETEFANCLTYEEEHALSFSPCPAHNHERPLKDGLYKARYGLDDTFGMLFVRSKGKWFAASGEKKGLKGGEVRYPEDIHSFTFICEIKE